MKGDPGVSEAAQRKFNEIEVSAMRALESLTVGGSEFVGDPAYCVEYVRNKVNTLQDIAKNAAKQRNEQAAEVSELREALRKYGEHAVLCTNWDDP